MQTAMLLACARVKGAHGLLPNDRNFAVVAKPAFACQSSDF